MFHLRHDMRLAVRSLIGAKGPVGIAVITLALGIGVTSAVFSILDAVVLRPVPYVDADRLVEIWNFETKSQVSHTGMPPRAAGRVAAADDLFDRFEAYEGSSSIYEGDAGAEMITGLNGHAAAVFDARRHAAQGRLFAEGDGRGGTDDLLIVSEPFWRQTLGRDPNVLGRALQLDQRRYVIVGVMPASFRFPDERDAVLEGRTTSMRRRPARARPTCVRWRAFALTCRWKWPPPASRSVVSPSTVRPVVRKGGPPLLQPAGSQIDRKTRLSLWVLGGAVAFLLLIVCANLANLSLSRTLSRSRDYAVRASLGASRGDLIRESLVEHGLVGVIGVLAGLAVAAGMLAAHAGHAAAELPAVHDERDRSGRADGRVHRADRIRDRDPVRSAARVARIPQRRVRSAQARNAVVGGIDRVAAAARRARHRRGRAGDRAAGRRRPDDAESRQAAGRRSRL